MYRTVLSKNKNNIKAGSSIKRACLVKTDGSVVFGGEVCSNKILINGSKIDKSDQKIQTKFTFLPNVIHEGQTSGALALIGG